MHPSFNDIAYNFDDLFEDAARLTDLEGEALDTLLKPYQVHTVLDCACGTGIQSIGLARRGYQVSASDISPRMVTLLKQKADAEALPIEVCKSDFRNLKPWRGRVFDAVVCSGNSLTLMQSDEEMLQSLVSMAGCTKKDGGVCIIGVHNYLALPDADRQLKVRSVQVGDRAGEVNIDVRFFGNERVVVTYFFISRTQKRWHMRTFEKSYRLLSPEALQNLMIIAGFESVQLFDVSGQRAYHGDEWLLAVGRI